MSYYAVKNGRNCGVYSTWDHCRDQVDGYSNASFKKFGSREEACAFVNDRGSSSGSRSWDASPSSSSGSRSWDASPSSGSGSRSWDASPSSGSGSRSWDASPSSSSGQRAVVYTDGCCERNGQYGAKAGLGVFWGEDHPLNTSEGLSGRQTNQRAEIQAATKAVQQAKSQNIKKLEIRTDSKFTINGATKWIHNWKKNDWTLSTGGPVVNKEDFQNLDRVSRGMDITWTHVPGHSGDAGNDMADLLARRGASKRY
ncbi:ribonuclease H1-like isoform X2 [Acipenser ruthenus]|nr:ribonuclease H1-like isoform X2 [Acipenser ruthenus]XP_033860034.3 ribonuclease H1-like isoform X2 [Acipenser ruthenus]XP_034777320.2 ribonuclease H1-like isoform X2 [Acipenser ruthenus]XP_034777321.2 ribonuclease H1-like isoform X2 [Acipenser ruthenus]